MKRAAILVMLSVLLLLAVVLNSLSNFAPEPETRRWSDLSLLATLVLGGVSIWQIGKRS